MAFQRAQWHSGLTYRQTCEKCKKVTDYTDYSLGFRPWYPDGFVYCPQCKTPMRHHESYAIDGPNAGKQNPSPEPKEEPQKESAGFCSQCGSPISPEDRFCGQCGNKLN